MKRLKFSLTAIAFVLGIGSAIATVSKSSDAPDCQSSTVCDTDETQVCCFDQAQQQDRLGQRIVD